MRLWSIHPKYLDSKGLTALWREGLLAKKVLEGKTKGYKNHPQLDRFKKFQNPIKLIETYLAFVYDESKKRDFNFDKTKISGKKFQKKVGVNKGQLIFEINHLRKKLIKRNREKYNQIKKVKIPKTNPVFFLKKGHIEKWEKTNILQQDKEL